MPEDDGITELSSSLVSRISWTSRSPSFVTRVGYFSRAFLLCGLAFPENLKIGYVSSGLALSNAEGEGSDEELSVNSILSIGPELALPLEETELAFALPLDVENLGGADTEGGSSSSEMTIISEET